ncbi:hypothetical protein [Methylocella sp. CPCC 101449]|jgi:hypothetical protein|uniref:hypothetical protein n=1 Tax=Methylocella sp. CPCC 101449 TaxID=2987531 RepID=UPI00288F6E6C|nr:hypothetical protein [Methylocella sp. CPCC 101449]MDT2023068.1 hypothetical protein [Methylocella sp. CPCC 101449]HEV2570266.1 hypothetical protein [Beijerinckiaceae bacterium]
MATREQRLADFITEGTPPDTVPCQLLCEDHVGTYMLPFVCVFVEGRWINERTGLPIDAKVVGWRPAARGASIG